MISILDILSVLDSGLSSGFIHTILAISVILTLLTMDFPDLSIEGTFPMGAALCGALIVNGGVHPLFSMVVVFGVGFLAGSITGALHVRFGMSKLLSGICVAAMMYSANLLIMSGKSNVPLIAPKTLLSSAERFDAWLNASLSLHPYFFHVGVIGLLLFIATALSAVIIRFLSSEFGTILRAVGINEKALAQYGRNPGFYKIMGLAIANGLAALAGALAAQQQGFAQVDMGVGVLVSSLVAVIMGQEIFSRLKIQLTRPLQVVLSGMCGAVFYRIILAGILSTGIPPTALRFFSGFVLVLLIMSRKRRTEVGFSW